MTTKTAVLTLLLACTSSIALATTVPMGPEYPAPGGNSYSPSGGLGDAGGLDISYTGFNLPAYYTNLWQGLWDPSSAVGSLDGASHTLSFSGVSGLTATWSGTTSWTNPDDSSFHPSVPIQMEIAITGGPVSWDVLPLAGYTFPAIGAVINNSTGADYSINILFSADTGGGFVPVNTIHQGGGGLTLSSVSLGFYSVPEPSSLVMAGIGLVAAGGCGVARRRRRAA